jgi:hypothetical protein
MKALSSQQESGSSNLLIERGSGKSWVVSGVGQISLSSAFCPLSAACLQASLAFRLEQKEGRGLSMCFLMCFSDPGP